MAAMQPGDRLLDRYELLERIGEGGMGSVFRAEQLALGREVAVKVIRREQSEQTPELQLRFSREAELAAKVEHRNVIGIIDFGTTDDGHQFIVMPLLRGEAMHQRLRRQPPPSVSQVLEWICAVLSGLHAIHDKGIVHRDLKPANVFLAEDADGVLPQLLDFGISRSGAAGPTGTGLTQHGSALGTPQYMAPEQFESARDVDHRADLYSVGAMLYQALTGRPPADGPDPFSVYRTVLTAEPDRVTEIRADLPEALGDVVHRALSKDPAARFEDARAMRDAIRDLLESGALDGLFARTPAEGAPAAPLAPADPLAPTTPALRVVRTQAMELGPSSAPPSTKAMSAEERASVTPATSAVPLRVSEGTPRRIGITPLTAVALSLGMATALGALLYSGALDGGAEDPVPAAEVESPRDVGSTAIVGAAASVVSDALPLPELAWRWARLAPAQRGETVRFVPHEGQWAALAAPDADAASLAAAFSSASTPADWVDGLTPYLSRVIVQLNLHTAPEVSSPTVRTTMRDTVVVALDGTIDGATSSHEGDDAFTYFAVSPGEAGWAVSRYLHPYDGCVPEPPIACSLDGEEARRDGAVARTSFDHRGRRDEVYVFQVRDRERRESCVAAYEAGTQCELGAPIGSVRLSGVFDEVFLTETAPVGGETLLVASYHATASMPPDGVLSWVARRVSDDAEVWAAVLPTAAFLPRGRRGAVGGSRDRVLQRREPYASLVVREPGQPRVFLRWDGERLVPEGSEAPSQEGQTTGTGTTAPGTAGPATDIEHDEPDAVESEAAVEAPPEG